MHKIWLIIKREYLVRIRKKSFIVMTILGPLLIAALMIIPIYLATESQQERIIAINQQEKFLLEDTEFLHFSIIPDFEATNLKKNFTLLFEFYRGKKLTVRIKITFLIWIQVLNISREAIMARNRNSKARCGAKRSMSSVKRIKF